MNETSHPAVVENPRSTPLFYVEVEESVFKKLHTIATKEQLPISQLASEILKMFIMAHQRELKALIETLKKRSRRG